MLIGKYDALNRVELFSRRIKEGCLIEFATPRDNVFFHHLFLLPSFLPFYFSLRVTTLTDAISERSARRRETYIHRWKLNRV